MKITVVDAATKRPLAVTKLQLQIRGKESGFLTLSTDEAGIIHLDDKYKGHQISALFNGTQGAWVAASEGTTISLATKAGAEKTEKNKETWK